MKCSWGHLNKRKPWNTTVFLEFWFLKVVSLYFDEHTMIVTDAVPTKDNQNITQDHQESSG
jgi:hypothetical protein